MRRQTLSCLEVPGWGRSALGFWLLCANEQSNDLVLHPKNKGRFPPEGTSNLTLAKQLTLRYYYLSRNFTRPILLQNKNDQAHASQLA
jgi:hypothetical protein